MRRKSINSDLINRRQEYWDSVIESCGSTLLQISQIPDDLECDIKAKTEMSRASLTMRYYNNINYPLEPLEAEGNQYWKDDPSYWWHKKYRT